MYQQAEINGFLQVCTHQRIKIYLYYQCQLFPVIFYYTHYLYYDNEYLWSVMACLAFTTGKL